MNIRDMDFGSLFKAAFWTQFAPIVVIVSLVFIVAVLVFAIALVANPDSVMVIFKDTEWGEAAETGNPVSIALIVFLGLLIGLAYMLFLAAACAISAVIGAACVRLYTAIFMKNPPAPAALPPPI